MSTADTTDYTPVPEWGEASWTDETGAEPEEE